LETSIQIVRHIDQRYNTVGDYIYNPFIHGIDIFISDTHNQDYNFLLAVHEMIESYLCWKRKISFEAIDKFDIDFEHRRDKKGIEEPGNDKKAPYYNEHQFAEKIEQLVCKELGIKWADYEKAIDHLYEKQQSHEHVS
jgi:hypothetical protein